MAIVRPVTKTLISTTQWGVPITDEVNRLTGLVDGNAPTLWTAMSFVNGWSNFGTYQACQYRKIGDLVYCRGMAKVPSPPNSIIATLPVGFRIAGNMEFPVTFWNGTARTPAIVVASTDGSIAQPDASVMVGTAFPLILVYSITA